MKLVQYVTPKPNAFETHNSMWRFKCHALAQMTVHQFSSKTFSCTLTSFAYDKLVPTFIYLQSILFPSFKSLRLIFTSLYDQPIACQAWSHSSQESKCLVSFHNHIESLDSYILYSRRRRLFIPGSHPSLVCIITENYAFLSWTSSQNNKWVMILGSCFPFLILKDIICVISENVSLLIQI